MWVEINILSAQSISEIESSFHSPMSCEIAQAAPVAHDLVPALGRQRQRQADFCEFEGSLDYRANSTTVKAMQRSPVSKKKKKITKNKIGFLSLL